MICTELAQWPPPPIMHVVNEPVSSDHDLLVDSSAAHAACSQRFGATATLSSGRLCSSKS